MHKRDIIPTFQKALGQYPVVTLVGPRQAGKTTVALALGDRPSANLENPETRRFATEDPRGFLAQFPEGAVIDEIQRVPEILSWIQVDVDQVAQAGRWILTGSHQPQLRAVVAQSLAGRTAMLQLYPFSLGEMAVAGISLNLNSVLVDGSYPRLHVAGIPAPRFFSDYVATYLERDIRQIANLRDLDAFQRYLGLTAGRLGSVVNWSKLGADTGISEVTAKAWSGILEASFVAFPLRPWHANIGKRLVKHPKFYWTDTGLASHLIGITDQAQIATHPLRGGLFENLIVSETLKNLAHWGSTARLQVFATQDREVDLLVQAGGKTLAIEIKSGQTISGDWLPNLKAATRIDALAIDSCLVVHGGDEEQCRTEATICPWWKFPVHLAKWLTDHQAAPQAPDLNIVRSALEANRK